MAMGYCGDCAHWLTLDEADRAAGTYPLQGGLHSPFGELEYRLCRLTVFTGDGDARVIKNLATARDASGYLAGLFTRAEFGCVSFEAIAPDRRVSR